MTTTDFLIFFFFALLVIGLPVIFGSPVYVLIFCVAAVVAVALYVVS